MDKKQENKKLIKRVAIFGTTGAILALGAAGSDDAREFATPAERAHLNIPSPAVTYTMYGASLLSFAAAIAFARKLERNTKQK